MLGAIAGDIIGSIYVPEAIIAFLDSRDWEDAIRNAVSLGGDADTLACITGSIAEAFYKELPEPVLREVHARLSPDLWTLTERFYRQYGIPAIALRLDDLTGEQGGLSD